MAFQSKKQCKMTSVKWLDKMTRQNDLTKWLGKMTRQNDKTEWLDKMTRQND